MAPRSSWLLVVGCMLMHCVRDHARPQALGGANLPPNAATQNLASSAATASPSAPSSSVVAKPPARLQCLTTYYDGHLESYATDWSIALSDGQRVSDNEAAMLFSVPYPQGPIAPVTSQGFGDPGAFRVDSLMFATYGHSADEVYRSLVRVSIAGHVIKVHRRIEAPFRRVAARVDLALKEDPSLARFFANMGGTYNWRTIAGRQQLSSHSSGIAIDIDVSQSNYWFHDHPMQWRNRIPEVLVSAFESEGFVWGGRWYYYDTMHFEYRPELFDPACRN